MRRIVVKVAVFPAHAGWSAAAAEAGESVNGFPRTRGVVRSSSEQKHKKRAPQGPLQRFFYEVNNVKVMFLDFRILFHFLQRHPTVSRSVQSECSIFHDFRKATQLCTV